MSKMLLVPAALLAVTLTASAQRSIPAGANILVRTNETIDSKTARSGQVFTAVVDKDVLDQNGNVAIPRGSNAELIIHNVNTGGATSSPDLEVDLQSVMVNGQRYAVATQSVTKNRSRGLGKNKRTAEMTGGGAALGAVLGAIAGGGHGAVIGAVAGAAAGAGVQVLTKGKEVRIPAETQLSFPLSQPLPLNPY